MKACFQIAEFSLSSTKIRKITQIERKKCRKMAFEAHFPAFSFNMYYKGLFLE